MNLREVILTEHSKAQCALIVQWVGDSQERFNELFHLFLTDEYRVVQRAAWPVSYCVQAHPGFIKANFGKLLKNLQKPGLHDAVKRNTIRLLQFVDIPTRYQGEVMNTCFTYLENPVEAVAVKAFSLTVLGSLARQYPDIIPEIQLLVQNQLAGSSPAFKARVKQLVKNLKL